METVVIVSFMRQWKHSDSVYLLKSETLSNTGVPGYLSLSKWFWLSLWPQNFAWVLLTNHSRVSSHESAQRKTKHREHKEWMRVFLKRKKKLSEWHLKYSQSLRERQRATKRKRWGVHFQSPNVMIDSQISVWVQEAELETAVVAFIPQRYHRKGSVCYFYRNVKVWCLLDIDFSFL